jgi:TFIIF-interacting CTD phosphatase-like protein
LIGRDLNKTIIVDNISENFLLQPENGISIKSWYDDMSDTALLQLAPLLIEISKQKVADVKVALKQSKE